MVYKSFSVALDGIKRGEKWARKAWKPNKIIELKPETADTFSHLMMVFNDGRKDVPWSPSIRCDYMEDDWYCVWRPFPGKV